MPRCWVLAAPAPQACRRHLGADIGPALGVTWGTLVAEEGGAKLQVSPSQCDGVVRSPFRKAGQGVSEAQGLWIMHRRHISVLPRGSRFAGETGASHLDEAPGSAPYSALLEGFHAEGREATGCASRRACRELNGRWAASRKQGRQGRERHETLAGQRTTPPSQKRGGTSFLIGRLRQPVRVEEQARFRRGGAWGRGISKPTWENRLGKRDGMGWLGGGRSGRAGHLNPVRRHLLGLM